MACRIPYINNQNFSETEKNRLFDIHVNVFKEAKKSGAFRSFSERLYSLKNDFAKAASFVGNTNSQYGDKIAKLEKDNHGNFLSVDVTVLAGEKQEELFFQKEQVDFNTTLNKSPEAADILFNLSDGKNVHLTGSLALSPQGSIYRDSEYGPHDLDFVAPNFTKKQSDEYIKSKYPNSIKIYDFKKGYEILTYLIPPKGTTIDSITKVKGRVVFYNIKNSKDEVVGDYSLDKDGKENSFGEKAILVDMFLDDTPREVFSHNLKLSNGKEKVISLAGHKSTFAAKIKLNRPKDIEDLKNFQLNDNFKKSLTPSIASPEVIKQVKEAAKKMGIDIQSLTDYLKGTDIDTKSINGVANLTKGVIAIAEGKEDVALIEELIHVATAMIEQANPKLITELISKIDRFSIYKRVLAEYRDNKHYQLPNGKPDIRKIKKEAVDKLIAEVIINHNENIQQNPELREEENLSLVRKMWNAILDWINGEYRKANISIFKDVAEKVMSGDIEGSLPTEGGEFFQLSDAQKTIQSKIAETKTKVQKIESKETTDPLLLDSEEATSYYELKQPDDTWKRIDHRVTDRVKRWYKKKFPGKIFTAQEKEFNELKRKYGVQGHLDFQEIHSRYFNSDGTKKDKPESRPVKFNLESESMYSELEKYYVALVDGFPEDTLIFSEVIIYDDVEKEAGTIDFMAVEPSGKTSILDWKFMNITGNEIAPYKQGAYSLQIGRYKEILKKNYGVKEFGMLRAIPISMEFKYKEKGDPSSGRVLRAIAVAPANPENIKESELIILPISEESESTGYDALDKVLKKLNAILKQIGKETATTEEDRQFKRDREETLRKAIRIAQVTHNIAPLIDVIEVMRKEGDKLLQDYELSYRNKPAKSTDSTDEDLSEFADNMNNFIKMSEVFIDISDDLGTLVYTESMDKEAITQVDKDNVKMLKDVLTKLEQESTTIRKARKVIIEASKEFADKHIGQRNNVTGFLNPEKVVKGLSSLFRGVSELGLRSLDILYKLVNTAQAKASKDALSEVEGLMAIREKLSKRGGDLRKLVQQIYQKDEKGGIANKLVFKFKDEFRKLVDEKAEAGGDLKWLKDNIDIAAYKTEAGKILETQKKRIEGLTFPGSQEEEEEAREREIEKLERQWDIDRKDFIGWNNYVIKRHPLAKWYSDEYNNVLKDKELTELYDYIVKFNEKAKDVGFIDNMIAKNFLPFVRKSMAEELVWDNQLSVMDNFRKSLTLNPGDVGYGKIDEITGKLENSIPKYYTHDFTKTEDGVNDYSEVSEDLFKNMILYIQQVEKYKYLSEVEGQLKLVKTIESFKGHLATNRISQVVFDENGKPEVVTGNEENAKLFDDFLRTMFYDQRYVLSDTDVPLNIGKAVNTIKRGVNKLAGKEIWKEEENPSPTSLIKTIDAANRAFQMKTLGLEFISGAVNAFGGNIQMLAQTGNYFNVGEFAKNEAKLIGQRFNNNQEREEFIALINTFMPLKEDPSYELYKKSGMHTLTRNNLGDMLMVFMREPEILLEKSVFLTLLENTMIENGKIVNIREFVKSKYKDRYNSSAKYNETKGKIEEEIKSLKATRSIAITKKLVDGKLEIPGLDLSDRQELHRLTDLSRRIARNATGNMSNGDINRMSMSVWTKSMMVFKNWIPKLADTRFSEFRKVSDDFSVRIGDDGVAYGQKYDIGRIRLLLSVINWRVAGAVRDIHNILALNDAGLKKLDEMLEEFKEKYKAETGEELTIDRDQFIDLIRINLRNQLRELMVLGSLMGMMLAIGFMAPDDEDDKATKNFHRYSLRVFDKFVNELSFFYNPVEFERILSGGIFPAVGLATDFMRFTKHFTLQVTGMDFDLSTSEEDVRKKAMPIKYAMKMAPITKSLVTYLSIFNSDFAKEYNVTIQKNNNR